MSAPIVTVSQTRKYIIPTTSVPLASICSYSESGGRGQPLIYKMLGVFKNRAVYPNNDTTCIFRSNNLGVTWEPASHPTP